MSRRVVAVAQSFKETLGVREVAAAYRRAIAAVRAECRIVCASDGGDGLLVALEPLLVRRTEQRCHGPLGEPVFVTTGWLDEHTAVLESRLACGLGLVPGARRDPLRTTTRGVGEWIDTVVAAGAHTVYVGLGGSATMDGGIGMARAWGWMPHDGNGRPVEEGGGALADIVSLKPGRRPGTRLVGLADVSSRLLGADGAARFAAQKGADPPAIGQLTRGLERLVAATADRGGRELAEREGAGAAGGLGFGILCFADGDLVRGADWVLDRVGFGEVLRGVDLVLTGEGAFDETSFTGKLTGEVLRRAREAGVPAALVTPRAAVLPPGVELETGSDEATWTGSDLERHAVVLLRRALRLPLS